MSRDPSAGAQAGRWDLLPVPAVDGLSIQAGIGVQFRRSYRRLGLLERVAPLVVNHCAVDYSAALGPTGFHHGPDAFGVFAGPFAGLTYAPQLRLSRAPTATAAYPRRVKAVETLARLAAGRRRMQRTAASCGLATLCSCTSISRGFWISGKSPNMPNRVAVLAMPLRTAMWAGKARHASSCSLVARLTSTESRHAGVDQLQRLRHLRGGRVELRSQARRGSRRRRPASRRSWKRNRNLWCDCARDRREVLRHLTVDHSRGGQRASRIHGQSVPASAASRMGYRRVGRRHRRSRPTTGALRPDWPMASAVSLLRLATADRRDLRRRHRRVGTRIQRHQRPPSVRVRSTKALNSESVRDATNTSTAAATASAGDAPGACFTGSVPNSLGSRLVPFLCFQSRCAAMARAAPRVNAQVAPMRMPCPVRASRRTCCSV